MGYFWIRLLLFLAVVVGTMSIHKALFQSYYEKPEGEYYYAGSSIVSKKMFGNHGLDGRGPDLKTTGGLMYYQYDGMRNVTSLTDRHGDIIENYRYDVFGNIFTGITAPYNTHGYTGMEYDPKAGLIDMHSRWYAPDTGRFISPDIYPGDLMKPYTQNLYAYVGNNPVNRWDPLGYAESDMPNSFYNNTRNGDIEEQYVYVKNRYWTESSGNNSYTSKGPDGWYTHWTNTLTEYWLYDYAYVKLRYLDEYSPDFGQLYEIIDSYMSQTTFTQTSVSYGVDFTPFTNQEWYEEHKDDLLAYGPLPSTEPWSVSLTLKYNSFYETSGTDIIFSCDDNIPVKDSQSAIIMELINKASFSDYVSGRTIASHVPGIEIGGKMILKLLVNQ